MPEQPSLPGLEARTEYLRPDIRRAPDGKPQRYKLFFGLFLPPDDPARVAEKADALCLQHGLTGSPVAADRLHVTLHVVGDFLDKVPLMAVEAARAAAATVVCPPLRIVFDQALSFQYNHAFVLRCDGGSDAAVARLRHTLSLAMRRAGLRSTPERTPHMTLLYRSPRIPVHPIEPIQWTAHQFALVLSHSGQTHHQWIGYWPLVESCRSPVP